MRMRRIGLGMGLALLAIGAARADAPPVLFPGHDAAVVYRGEHSGGPPGQPPSGEFDVAWNAELQRLRFSSPGMPGFAIVDFRTRHMFMVMSAQRIVMDLPMNVPIRPGPLRVPPGGHIERVGSATVAGQGCTLWHMTSPKGSGTACITSDGIPLRMQGDGAGPNRAQRGMMEAISVQRGPEPESLFTVPAGYRHMDISHMGGPPGAPPGASPGAAPGH